MAASSSRAWAVPRATFARVLTVACRLALCCVALVLVAGVAACGQKGGEAAKPAPTAPPAPGAGVEVIVDGAHVFALGPRDFVALEGPPGTGAPSKGITLSSVLRKAGINDFRSVDIKGRDAKGETSLRLASAEVGDQVVLARRADGIVELLGASQKLSSVVRIEVQGAQRPTPERPYAVEVVADGRSLVSLTLADLQRLPKSSVDSQEGPALLEVLRFAGIKEFRKVVLVGKKPGRGGPAELSLDRGQVDNQVLLDFTKQGTVKLAGPKIPQGQWVIDVTRISVEGAVR